MAGENSCIKLNGSKEKYHLSYAKSQFLQTQKMSRDSHKANKCLPVAEGKSFNKLNRSTKKSHLSYATNHGKKHCLDIQRLKQRKMKLSGFLWLKGNRLSSWTEAKTRSDRVGIGGPAQADSRNPPPSLPPHASPHLPSPHPVLAVLLADVTPTSCLSSRAAIWCTSKGFPPLPGTTRRKYN